MSKHTTKTTAAIPLQIVPPVPDGSDDSDLKHGDDKEATAPGVATPPPLTGTARIFGADGKPRIPNPTLPATALEKKRAAESHDLDELPADFKKALALQYFLNRLPNGTPGKEQRLKRITKHVAFLQSVPDAPIPNFAELQNQFFGRPSTEVELSATRQALIGKAKRK